MASMSVSQRLVLPASAIPVELQILAGIRAGLWTTADPFATVAEDTGHFSNLQPDVDILSALVRPFVSSCVVPLGRKAISEYSLTATFISSHHSFIITETFMEVVPSFCCCF